MPSAIIAKVSKFWEGSSGPPSPTPQAPDANQAAMPPGPPVAGKTHKMTVLLTAAEYEKLGIAAVKKGVTRHQVVRTALDLHLERLQQEYAGCACMTVCDSCDASFDAA